MAEFTQTSDEEAEFSSYIDELESQGEQVMEDADRDDASAKKQAQAAKVEHAEEGVVTRSEYLADKFLATASDEEARLFAIYRRGDEDPRQLKAIIDLSKTKAAEVAKATGAVVEEKADQKATKIAQEAYGVGPLGVGQTGPEDDGWDAARERVRSGDMHTAFQMFNSLPSTGGVTTEE